GWTTYRKLTARARAVHFFSSVAQRSGEMIRNRRPWAGRPRGWRPAAEDDLYAAFLFDPELSIDGFLRVPAMQSPSPPADNGSEEALDPADGADTQAVAHRAVDEAIAYLRELRDRPVWQDMPGEVERTFATRLPRSPTPLSEVYQEVLQTLMPYPM